MSEPIDKSLVDELKERVNHMEENPWESSMDGFVWAQKFVEYKKRYRWTHSEIDVDLMTTWFARAIMVGYDEGIKRASAARSNIGEE